MPDNAGLIPLVTEKKLIAYRAWCDYRVLRAQLLYPPDFQPLVMTRFLDYVADSQSADSDAKEDRADVACTVLDDSKKWRVWSRMFISMVNTHLSSKMKTPLGYVLRPVEEVTQEQLDAEYPSLEEDLFATSALHGAQFTIDNKRVWHLLKNLLAPSPFWTHVRSFDESMNGRGAYFAMKRQMEGPAALADRKSKAHADLTTVYTGKNNKFTIDDYIRVHQEAHQELQELEVPVDAERKVALFMAGLKADALLPAKKAIKVNLYYRENFEAIQQEIRREVNELREEARVNRTVGSVATEKPSGGGSNHGRKNRKSGGKSSGNTRASKKPKFASKDKSGFVPSNRYVGYKEYASLSEKQQLALREFRAANKDKKDITVGSVETQSQETEKVVNKIDEGDLKPAAVEASATPVVAVSKSIDFGRASYAKPPTPVAASAVTVNEIIVASVSTIPTTINQPYTDDPDDPRACYKTVGKVPPKYVPLSPSEEEAKKMATLKPLVDGRHLMYLHVEGRKRFNHANLVKEMEEETGLIYEDIPQHLSEKWMEPVHRLPWETQPKHWYRFNQSKPRFNELYHPDEEKIIVEHVEKLEYQGYMSAVLSRDKMAKELCSGRAPKTVDSDDEN